MTNIRPYGWTYLVINLINNKKYIGQTTQLRPDIRWQAHLQAARRANAGHALHRAIRKYGVENFTFIVIGSYADQATLDAAEDYHIDACETLVPHGYNLKRGGAHGRLSEETKTRIKAAANQPEVRVQASARAAAAWAAMTPEQRSERGYKLSAAGRAALTPEQLSEMGRKMNAALTPEQRRANARKAVASITPEQRRAIGSKGAAAMWATMTPEQRSELGRKGAAAFIASLTPEQRRERSERMRKFSAILTFEQRSANARKGKVSMTPEQRSEMGRKMNDALTPEQRLANIRKLAAALTPEQRSEMGRKMNAKLTPDQRSANARKGAAAMTPEQREKRRERMRKVMKARWAVMTPEDREKRKERMHKLATSMTPEQRRVNARKAAASITPEDRERRRERMRKANITRRSNLSIAP